MLQVHREKPYRCQNADTKKHIFSFLSPLLVDTRYNFPKVFALTMDSLFEEWIAVTGIVTRWREWARNDTAWEKNRATTGGQLRGVRGQPLHVESRRPLSTSLACADTNLITNAHFCISALGGLINQYRGQHVRALKQGCLSLHEACSINPGSHSNHASVVLTVNKNTK